MKQAVNVDSALHCGQADNISCFHGDNYPVNNIIINLTSDIMYVCQFSKGGTVKETQHAIPERTITHEQCCAFTHVRPHKKQALK